MEFLVLGPVEVRVGRTPLGLGGPRPRAVLADLVLHSGSVLPTAGLIDDLWGAAPPPSAEAIVQNAVSRLRKTLGRTTIETVPAGYVLTVDPGSIDAHRFERLLRDARPLPAQERVSALREALALWRGPAYSELAFEGFLQGEIARLDELRLTALEDKLEAEIELGLHDQVEAELEALASHEPGRERLRRLQMLALHRSGRTQDALDVYEEVRRAFDELSGLEPGAETKALQLMILRDDPLISSSPASASRGSVARRPVALLVSRVVTDPGADLEAAAGAVASGHEAFHAAAARHGGVVSSPYGSESVAVFGAEIAHDDDVLRAGRAAIETQAILRSRGVPVRLGLGAGRLLVDDGVPLILGGLVDEVRQSLEAAGVGEIVVARSAAEAAGGAFATDRLNGRVLLGGVISGRPSAGFVMPLVGRDAELAHLDSALRSAAEAATPVHVVVIGEAGIGKTRLVREFATSASAVTLSATCIEYGEGITFHPLRELAAQAEALDASAPPLHDVSSADAAFAGVRDLVQHFSASGPVIVALDDLQWGMPMLLDLVEYLTLACRGPALVVSAARPELLERRPAWKAHVLALEPLAEAETQHLIEACSAVDPLSPELVEQLVVASDGVPLFAEQLAEFARTERGSAVAARIPPSLDAVLAGRLDSITAGELVVMQHAAVIGPQFERAELAALADPADVSRLDGRLAALCRSGLLRVGDDSLHGFAHALVRDAAYEGISKARRAALHEGIARHRDLHGEADTIMSAVHLEAAALLSREVGSPRPPLELEAGQRLAALGLGQWRAGDASGAANLLGRCCALLPPDDPIRLDASIELGLAQRDLGESRQAVELLEGARQAARRLRRRRVELRANVELIVPAVFSGLATEAELDEVLLRAMPVFRRARDDRSSGRALLVRATLASIGCRFADAEIAAESAYTHLTEAGYQSSRAVLVLAAAAFHGMRSVTDGRDRCVELHRRVDGNVLAQANVNLIRALIEGLGAEPGRAAELLDQAARVYEERGLRLMLLADYASVRAEIAIMAGELEAGASILESAASELERGGETGWASRHDAARAELALAVSGPTSALPLVRHAAARTPAIDLHANVTCMRITGKALAAKGQCRAGGRLVRKALAALKGTDALELRFRVLADLAEVEASAGNPDGARSALDRAATAAAAKGSVVLERRVEALRAQLDPDETPGVAPPGPL